MKLLKKKLNKPFRHVYTDDDYKWVGRKNNYQISIRQKTEDTVKYWFYIEEKDQTGYLYDSKEDGLYFESIEIAVEKSIEYVTKNLH